jgi:predicted metal-dependent HD superfamily phosphohydrolase
MTDTATLLYPDWTELWRRISSKRSDWIEAKYRLLVTRYGEPHRAYHTLAHIQDCLNKLSLCVGTADDLDALECAIWYHDVVYHTYARPEELPSNEMLSAEVADANLAEAGVPMQFRKKIFRLIMATTHTGTLVTTDEKLIADIDWSGIGRPWDEFVKAGERIQKEFAALGISEGEYRKGRLAFFKKAAARKEQYHLREMRARYEAQAWKNITRAIEELEVMSVHG